MLCTLLAMAMALAAQPQEAAPAVSPAGATEGPGTGSVSWIDPSVWTTPGSRIPDVELPRVDGEGLVRLSDYEGKRLLLIQFASW